MKFATLKGLTLRGICACVPANFVDNRDSGRELFGEEIESIIKTIGVQQRRVCSPEKGTTALDLAVTAGKKLLEQCSVDPSKIGAVFFVTQTPDYPMPNNSSLAVDLLGLSQSCAATDLSMGCSGYVYGLWVSSLAAQSLNSPVLLLAGENHSYCTSPYDRATSLLFGDAGTATLILPEGDETWHFGFLTDASQKEALIIPEGGSRKPFNGHSLDYKTWSDGGVRRPIDITMDGMGVFNFVIRNVPRCIDALIEKFELSHKNIDYLLLHQANLYMMKQIARKLNIPFEKVPISLDRFGNSSSATLPVTISSELEGKLSSRSNSVLLAGYGVGLSIAVASINLGPHIYTHITDY